MKVILILFISVYLLTVYAYDNAYHVKGIDGKGETIEGVVYSYHHSPYIWGELSYDQGDTHAFHGLYSKARGCIIGETEEGEPIELYTKGTFNSPSIYAPEK